MRLIDVRCWSCCLGVALLAIGGCTNDATAPEAGRDGPVHVSITVVPATINPGQSAAVTVAAVLPDTQTLTSFQLRLSGFGGDTVVNLPIVHPGPLAYVVTISVPTAPIEGVLLFHARASVRTVSDSTNASLTIHDDGPPRVVVTAPHVVEPPDSLRIAVSAEDAAGITELTIHLEGAMRGDTTISVADLANVAWSLAAALPDTARLGDTIHIRATAHDGFGKTAAAAEFVRIIDTTPPIVVVQVDTIHHAGVDEFFFPLAFFPGDVVRFRITVSDNLSLAWVGYHMLQFADSVAVDSSSAMAQFEITIPPGTNTPDAYIQAVARDASSNQTIHYTFAVVMDGTFRPIDSLTLHGDPLHEFDRQSPYVVDTKREVLYFATFTTTQLQILGLAPLEERPAIEFGGWVRGVDLTPGSDSVVVLVVGRPNLLVMWNIAAGPSTADTIPVPLLGDCDGWDMQVAANGHALVTGWSQTGCPTVDVDLRTRAQRVRSFPPMLRSLTASPDHRTIVAWDDQSAAVYHSDMDTLGPVQDLFVPYQVDVAHAGPSMDQTGAEILFRNRLYGPDLTAYRWIQPDAGLFAPAHDLSLDGQTAFLGLWPGYSTVDVSTATAVDHIILPRSPWQIIAHPDGQRLIVFGWRWVGVVHLR